MTRIKLTAVVKCLRVATLTVLATLVLATAHLGEVGGGRSQSLAAPAFAALAWLASSLIYLVVAHQAPTSARLAKHLIALTGFMFLAGVPLSVLLGVALQSVAGSALWQLVNVGGLVGGVLWLRILALNFRL